MATRMFVKLITPRIKIVGDNVATSVTLNLYEVIKNTVSVESRLKIDGAVATFFTNGGNSISSQSLDKGLLTVNFASALASADSMEMEIGIEYDF